MKINRHIEIVRSSIACLSSLSQNSCDAIYVTLSKHYKSVGVSIVNNPVDLEKLVALQPDLVFLGMKFVPAYKLEDVHEGDKIWLAEYLDKEGIAYTGSNHFAHELELNKALAKARVQSFGLKTARYFEVRQNRLPNRAELLKFPLFVKPANRGGGLGIDSNSVVHNFEQLKNKVRFITTKFMSNSLVEEYLPGREFSVAILRRANSQEYSAMPIELLAPADKNGNCILSAEVKSADTESFEAVIDKDTTIILNQLALDVFHALGARDYGRIDIRFDKHGVPHFLEANLIPSLIENYGNFPKACFVNLQMDYEDMLLHIVELGFSRLSTTENVQNFMPVERLSSLIPLAEVE